MLVDGKAIAQNIRAHVKGELQNFSRPPKLAAIVTHLDAPTKQFLTIKQKVGAELGIPVEILELSHAAKNEDLAHALMKSAREFDGIVVQLPLAKQFSLETVKQLLPVTHDIDVLGDMAYAMFTEHRLPILPPVVSAMNEIIKFYGVRLAGKEITVVGSGMLVGKPAAQWFRQIGGKVKVVTKREDNLLPFVQSADVVVLGAGSPGLLKPDMVQEGVIILDAGTSELSGALVGDADPLCAQKAALFTPTPGGIGPITVAMIFHNLVTLVKQTSE